MPRISDELTAFVAALKVKISGRAAALDRAGKEQEARMLRLVGLCVEEAGLSAAIAVSVSRRSIADDE